MALVFSSLVEIEASPQRIVDAFTRFDDWHDWMPGLVSVECLTDAPFGIETRWKETCRMFGKEAFEVFEVTDYDPPESLPPVQIDRQENDGDVQESV